jgi:hypothetical protein
MGGQRGPGLPGPGDPSLDWPTGWYLNRLSDWRTGR